MGESDDDSVVISFQYLQVQNNRINKMMEINTCKTGRIFLDTGSTCSVFKDAEMITNIRKVNKTICAYTNRGRQDSNMIADLPDFFEVWYNPESMVNIISWSDVCKKYRITTDTSVDNTINLHVRKKKLLSLSSFC